MSQSRSKQNISDKRTSRFSLQTRLVFFVLTVALVPLIIIATRDTLQTQQALTNGAEVSMISSAAQTANSLDTFIQTTLDSISIESQLPDFAVYLTTSPSLRAGSIEQARAKDLLNKLGSKDTGNIISYALVDTDGNVLLDSTDRHIQKNEAEEAYFPQVRFSNEPIVTAVTYIDEKTTSITFASKILDDKGDYVGILRAKYNSSILQSVVVKNSEGSSDTLILLLDPLYIRLADSRNPSMILKSIEPLNLVDYLLAVDSKRFLDIPREKQSTNFTDFAFALDNAAEQPFFRVDITPNIPGDDTVAVAFMETQPWLVAYTRPTSIFLADVQKQIRTNIILVLGTSIIISIITALIARSLANPITALAKVANLISQGDLNARAEVKTSDEIGSLASAFNSMTDQLQSTLVGLEQRIYDRTVDLKKSNLELEIIAEVAREIAIILDMQTLLNVSVNLIRERLNYYHVGIFLVEERGEFALLQAASSIAADKMLAHKIKFRINGIDLLGNTLRAGQVYYSPDVNQDKALAHNLLLPETVSEAILPLSIRNVTIGVLDIQASNSSSLGTREINTLKLLADQLAAAIENAQLAQQVDETLSALKYANRLQTQQTWRATINQRERPAYEYDGLQVRAIPRDLPGDLLKQLENGKPIVLQQSAELKDAQNTLIIPLMILNQVIGVIGLEQEDPNRIWTDEDLAIAQAAANRAALTLENSRLLEESQRRAAREQAIGQISAKIGAGTEIETILKTAIKELGTQIGGAQITVEIGNESE